MVHASAYLIITGDDEIEAFRLKQSAEQAVKDNGGYYLGKIDVKKKYMPRRKP